MDAKSLLELAESRSAADRRKLAEAVGTLFSDSRETLTERERHLMGDILVRLLHETEMELRRDLAARLADWPEAPEELIVLLANDAIPVAREILLRSQVLKDPQLIEIITNRSKEHQLCIAGRHSVSQRVSGALVATGQEEVILELLRNEGADLAEETVAFLVDEAERVDSFREPLVRRKELPKRLASKLVWFVSAALRLELRERFDLPLGPLEDHLEEAGLAATQKLAAEAAVPQPVDRLAERLAERRKLTPELLVSTLERGETSLFKALFARHVGLQPPQVERVLYDPSGYMLAIACKASDIPQTQFARLALFIRDSLGRGGPEAAGHFSRLGEWFNELSRTEARRVVQHWQRDPAFLEAVDAVSDGLKRA